MSKTKYLLPLILILFLTFTLIGDCDWLEGWGYRIEIDLPDYAGDIGGSVTWFPVTVFLTNSKCEEVFVELTDEEYNQVAFTKADGTTELYADCELFNVAGEKGIYHVSRDGWTINANTSIFLYYDSTHIDNDTYISRSGGTAAQSVWDGNFKAVYHMNDTGTANAIDVGEPTGLSGAFVSGTTYIALNNPSNYSGKLTSISIYASINLPSAKIATFYESDGKYTARDVYSIGAVTIGAERTFTVDLDIVAGDYIGIYWPTSGSVYRDTSGEYGVPYLAGDQTACVDATFDLYAGDNIYVLGVGITINILDSTSNNNDGTKKGVGEPLEENGKEQHFDGVDDYITTPTLFDVIPADGTVSMYLAPDNASEAEAKYLWYKKNDNDNRFRCYWLAAAGEGSRFIGFEKYNATVSKTVTTTTSIVDSYYLITCTYGSDGMVIYVNDTSEDTDADTNAIVNGTDFDFTIGSSYILSTNVWDGVYRELRVSSTQRAVAWVKGTYNSLFDNLLTYGSEEEKPVVSGANIMFMFGMF